MLEELKEIKRINDKKAEKEKHQLIIDLQNIINTLLDEKFKQKLNDIIVCGN